MEPLQVNLWAVLFCTALNVILSLFWYSPSVLGNVWAKELGLREDSKPGLFQFIGALVVAFILNYVLNMVIHTFNITGLANGLSLAFFIWLGFIATTHFSSVIWAKKPFVVYFIEVGFLLFNLLLISTIMTIWQ